MSVADSLGRSASVTTLEDSTFLWMEGKTFLSGIEEVPAISRNLLDILSRRLRLADTHTRSLAALDVHGRVAAQLLAFAREYGEPLPDGGTLIPCASLRPTWPVSWAPRGCASIRRLATTANGAASP